MIQKLEQLTAARFIDLVCGDTSVLRQGHEVIDPACAAKAMRNIMHEYREIADNAGARAYISDMTDLVRARMAVSMLAMCHNLVTMNQADRTREVLEAFGINASAMDDNRIAAEVESQLERARQKLAELDARASDLGETDIRKEFDAQTAMLTAYFKFQFDTETMKATVYAHLVARHNRELKAQLDALKKK